MMRSSSGGIIRLRSVGLLKSTLRTFPKLKNRPDLEQRSPVSNNLQHSAPEKEVGAPINELAANLLGLYTQTYP